MNYSGDLVRGFSFSTSTPAFTAFYRANLSEIVTIRLGLVSGSVTASEIPIDAFAATRNHSFNSSVLELSSTVEYHFLNFKNEGARVNYSPYVVAGFGIMNFQDAPEGTDRQQPVLPIGFGFKYLIKKKYTIGIETAARKTFFDYLDGVSDGDQTVKDFQYGNPNDDDWYFFTGITFSVTLFDIPCPFPYRPNNTLSSR